MVFDCVVLMYYALSSSVGSCIVEIVPSIKRFVTSFGRPFKIIPKPNLAQVSPLMRCTMLNVHVGTVMLGDLQFLTTTRDRNRKYRYMVTF